MKSSLAAIALCAAAFLACEERPREGASPLGSEQSPNASILPAPLAPGPETKRDTRPGTPGAPTPNLPPKPYPHDRELVSEVSPERDIGGLELRAEFVWQGVEVRELPARGRPDPLPTAGSTKADAGKNTETRTLSTLPTLRIRITTNGRMFAELTSPTFTLPEGTQLMARLDRWGHVVVWPDGRSYRVAPRGSLRALFEERRVDVAPLLDGDARPSGSGKRFDLTTERRNVQSPLGEVALESVVDPTLEASGTLVCRFLLELIRIDPGSDLCPSGELPVEATFKWLGGGELGFRVSSLKRVMSFAAAGVSSDFAIPPAMPIFKPGELPPVDSPLLWSEQESRSLFGASGSRDAALTLDNPTELPLFVLVDRVPAVRVAARDTATWTSVPRSRTVAIRDFLGERTPPPQVVAVPGKLTLGAPEVPAAEGQFAGEVPGQLRPASIKAPGSEPLGSAPAPSARPER